MFLAGLPVTRKLCVRSGNKEVGVGLEKWRKLPTGLTLHIRLFYVANSRRPTVININVLDTNVLLPAEREPDAWRTGKQCLERALRMHLL